MTYWPMAPEDAIFHRVESETVSQSISMVAILDRLPDLARLERSLAQSAAAFPRFRWRVSAGAPFHWEEDARFDAGRHLESVIRPEIRTRQDLVAEASRHISRPLPRESPLWRFVVIANQNADAAFHGCLVATAHHSVTDAVGAFTFWNTVCADGAAPAAGEAEPVRQPRDRGWGERWRQFSSTGRQFIGDCLATCQPSPLTGTKSAARSLICVDITRQQVRTARRILRCSLQELMLTMVAGAAQRYHHARGVRSTSQLQALVPLNDRVGFSGQPANRFITVRIPLEISAESVADRLAHVRKQVALHSSAAGRGSARWASRLALGAPAAMQPRIIEQAAKQSHLFCTVVPGPLRAQNIAGAGIIANYLTAAHLTYHGVSFAFLTYGESVHAAILADPAVVAEPEELERQFHESVREVLDACEEHQSL